MLAQLVCLDRRYQRMNCFNMRELQALLKEKYFSDLVNNYDYRSNIFNTVNLRYKLNDLSTIDNNLPLFNNNSLKLTFFVKVQNFDKGHTSNDLTFTNLNYFILTNYEFLTSLKSLHFFKYQTSLALYLRILIETSMENVFGTLVDALEVAFFNTKYFFVSFLYNVQVLSSALVLNNKLAFNFYFPIIINSLFFDNVVYTSIRLAGGFKSYFISTVIGSNTETLITKSEHKTPLNDSVYFNNGIGESLEESRALRFNNPVFRYDYKLGNYLNKETINNFPHLMLSQTQVTGGIRKSSYIYSAHFMELFKANVSNYLTLFTPTSAIPSSLEPEMRHASATSGFYNLFVKYYAQPDFINTH